MLNSGERQVASNLDGIRADHKARYEWLAEQLPRGSYVLDYGCGVGYGAWILAKAGHQVVAVDDDPETVAFASANFAHKNIRFVVEKQITPVVCRWPDDSPSNAIRFDAAAIFEVVEHIADPKSLLKAVRGHANALYASVPNEAEFPYRSAANGYKGYIFHHRHYTREQFDDLLRQTGWLAMTWHGQADASSQVEYGPKGRTIIAAAVPSALNALVGDGRGEPLPEITDGEQVSPGIGHVVILGLGPSAEQYVDLVKRLGGRKAFADQVWAINALGDVLACDLVFHMDDIRVQEMRAAAAPQSNIAPMVRWLRTHSGPVMTSRAHPDYPALVEFPLEDVINSLGYAYFNGTAAYAVAYAIYRGASKISFFGCDFSMANTHQVEKGRACVEFWIGFAAARGIELGFADETSLMDTCAEPKDPNEIGVYGFDFDRVLVETVAGAAKITLEPRSVRPTAAEIEARYDHSARPPRQALVGRRNP